MGDRGRKSQSELAVVKDFPKSERPEPPDELTAEQREEWRAVVNRLPPEWFPRETYPLLTAYCRHVTDSRDIARQIEEWKGNPDGDIKDYDRLLKMQERENRSMSSLATRMRLTQQSTYDPKKSKGKDGKRPWEANGSN